MTIKFEVKAGEFASAAAAARRVIESKTTIPILANLLIEAQHDVIKVAGADLDVTLTVDTPATITEPGSITVPAARLADLVAGMDKAATVKVELGERGLAIRSGRSRYLLGTLPVADFPTPLTAGSRAVELELDAAGVQDLFVAPSIAVSTKETRYYLNGIYLHGAEGKLGAAATDGHRLILVKTELRASGVPGIIVPRKTVAELAKLGKDGLKLRISPKIIEAVTDTRRLASKLIDATFPDYGRIIPTRSDNTAEIDRADLIEALNRLRAVTDGSERWSPCGIEWSDSGEIELCLANDPGAGSDALAAATSGQARVAVSINLLSGLLDAPDGERVQLDVTNATSPVRITTAGNPELLQILMPMASSWLTAGVAA
jgi:DNA polymerase-3 subunit beta